jgi:hypothetical protein
MQPISFRHPAIEGLWALAVHQMWLGFALWLLTTSKLARRRTQLKICRSAAIEKRSSPATPKARQCACSSRIVAVSCKTSVAAKLVPTINSSRPCGIRRYRATIGFRAACRLNSTLGGIMIRKLLPYLLLLSAVVSLLGWGNAYVTLATNDQKAYASVLWQAFVLLGVSQVMLIAVATQKKSAVPERCDSFVSSELHAHLSQHASCTLCF